jgi:branched-subunit amino acid aminotransferase/4-amino-4-deoxychorismate lyase
MPPEQYCYYDKRLMPLWEARVAPDDLGILRGFAIYEGITAFGPFPFHFKDHWLRFERSAKALGLALPLSEDEAFDACASLIEKNAPDGGRVNLRMILSGGPAVGGIEYDRARSNFYILAEKHVPLSERAYQKGAALITHEHARFMPECKTVGYITAVMLQPKRKAEGALEILYVDKGQVLECSTSNICIVEDGRVIAPKEGVLAGITRAIALELARETYPVEERPVTLDELFAAQEVFITSSFKDIVPIVSVDGKEVGGGAPGPITKDLMARFEDAVRGDSR